MEAVITFLAVDRQEDESKGVKGLIDLCSDLFKKATLAMTQAPTHLRPRLSIRKPLART
jgi:hypothetical protein